MSFLSDTLKKYTGQYHTNTSRPARETHQVSETRSFDIPVKEKATEEFAGGVRDELSKTAAALKDIKAEVANLENMQGSIKDFFEEQKRETAESIHKENVKVYRNVQAVVVDETSKLRESIEKSSSDKDTKLNTAMVFAILAFVISVLHFAFSILVSAGVF